MIYLDVLIDNRLYHFQTENAEEQRIWMSVLINCKEKQLNKTFEYSQSQMSSCLVELQRDMIKYIQSMPGNQRCCDCSSTKGKTVFIRLTIKHKLSKLFFSGSRCNLD